MNATGPSDPPPMVAREVWADLVAVQAEAPAVLPRRSPYWRWLERVGVLMAPVAIAWIAIRLFVPALFVCETSFMLRNEAPRLSLPSSDFSGVAGESGSPDAYAVRDYLQSADARAAAGFRAGDRVRVDYETGSGVITVRAAAPDAAEAYRLAGGMRAAAAGLVGRFDRISADREDLETLAAPQMPDAPVRESEDEILLGAIGLGLVLAWSRR